MDAIPEFTRDLLVSLRPRHASNILTGEKTVESHGREKPYRQKAI